MKNKEDRERRRVVYQDKIFLIFKPRNVETNGSNGSYWADQGAKKTAKAVYDSLTSGNYSFEFSEEARIMFLQYIDKNIELARRARRGELTELLSQAKLI